MPLDVRVAGTNQLIVTAVSPAYHADVMFEPGANRCRHEPMLEKPERASVRLEEPTVRARAPRLGQERDAR